VYPITGIIFPIISQTDPLLTILYHFVKRFLQEFFPGDYGQGGETGSETQPVKPAAAPASWTRLCLPGKSAYNCGVRASDFDFPLPASLIAQKPAPAREQSRLLVLHRRSGRIEHRRFTDLVEFLRPGDALVLNDSKVIPARLRGLFPQTGAPFEVLLLTRTAPLDWWAMMKPGRKARPGTLLEFLNRQGQPAAVRAEVLDVNAEGHRLLRFTGTSNLAEELPRLGEVPLPPYIERQPGDDLAEDDARYQTVYARVPGSVAAPTAGLHFTPQILDTLQERGARIAHVTLHVGPGTFAPVKAGDLADHVMHEEQFTVSEDAAQAIDSTRGHGRIVAAGTTTVRVLETLAATHNGRIEAESGATSIFIHPPFPFRVVDVLLTNFHLPRSTLLMLVSAFAAPGEPHGRDLILAAYAEAVRERYRFFSYGDAMLIL
jgi:S-adenosylmethionine:tRNA ribosyltransferase-isomerase